MVEVKCAHDEMVPVEKLVPNPRNPNKHPAKQIELLAKIIGAQGWRAPVSVSRLSGFIVRGHGRYEAALKMGCESVPVDFQDYGNEAEEWADLIADNRIAELASIDEDELTGILQEMHQNFKDFDLTLTGVEDIAARLAGADGAGDAPEPQIDRAEELQKEWKTATGQVWSIGKHRLMCGDSTKKDDVDRLMGGVSPTLMVTDPPYGIGYEYSKHDDSDSVKNDKMIEAAFLLGPSQIIWTCGLMNLSRELDKRPQSKVVVWWKKFAAAGNGLGGASTWEPILFCGVKGATLPNDVIECPTERIPGLRELHSCPKPVPLFSHIIGHIPHDIIYEPFLGSGTTLIACEQLTRICYGMEIDPKYVAVTLQRMADMGLKPELVEG